MTNPSELRISQFATPLAVRAIRHALDTFLKAHDVELNLREDVATGVGEALINAVEHAYGENTMGRIEFYARLERNGRLVIDVCDEGRFVPRKVRRRDRGFGLHIIRNVADDVTVNTDHGTTVRMTFNMRNGRMA